MFSVDRNNAPWKPSVLKWKRNGVEFGSQLHSKEVDDFMDSLLDENRPLSPPVKKACWNRSPMGLQSDEQVSSKSTNSQVDNEVWSNSGYVDWTDSDYIDSDSPNKSWPAIGPGAGFAQPFWANPIPPSAVKGAPRGSSPLEEYDQDCLLVDPPPGSNIAEIRLVEGNRLGMSGYSQNSTVSKGQGTFPWSPGDSFGLQKNGEVEEENPADSFWCSSVFCDDLGDSKPLVEDIYTLDSTNNSSSSPDVDSPDVGSFLDHNQFLSEINTSEEAEGTEILKKPIVDNEKLHLINKDDSAFGLVSCENSSTFSTQAEEKSFKELSKNEPCGKMKTVNQNSVSHTIGKLRGKMITLNQVNPTTGRPRGEMTTLNQSLGNPTSQSPRGNMRTVNQMTTVNQNLVNSTARRPVDLLERLAAAVRSKTTEKLSVTEGEKVNGTENGAGMPLPSAEKVVRRIMLMVEKRRTGEVKCESLHSTEISDSNQAIAVKRRFESSESVLRTRLLRLAEDAATGDLERAGFLKSLLEDDANSSGTVMQRIVFYFLKGLDARQKGGNSEDFLRPLELSPFEMQSMEDISNSIPVLTFAMDFINDSILDVVGNKDSIHIIDLSMWVGQWVPLIRSLSKRTGGPPFLRITGIEAPAGTICGCGPKLPASVLNMEIMMAASEAGVRCEYSVVVSRLEDLRASDLKLRHGEVLAVAGAMRLPQLPDGSVVRSNPRDNFLKKLRSWNPQVLVLCDHDTDQNSPFFLARFKEALDHFTTLFDFFDNVASRTSLQRKVFEEKIFGREILDVVASEGLHRIQRAEKLAMVQSRMQRCGFRAKVLNEATVKSLKQMASQINEGFGVTVTNEALQLTWKGRSFLAAHAWRT